MAAFTSTQTGNFSSAATWGGGGAPSADGDTFTVANGHTVTIDTGITNPTNGFGDSTVQSGGVLQSQASQSTTLRMDGLLTISGGGTLHLRAGATIEVTGTSGENHGIQCNGLSNVVIEGSDGMPCTTLAAGTYNEGTTSFTFTSAANFAAGEWFCIFNNTTDYVGEDQYQSPPQRYEDEGFWVHEISGNTVYFRRYVSPLEVTVTEVIGGAVATIANSKRLRVNDKVIFGTGANRNIKTVSSIDYVSNQVTFDSSITGTVEGETLYLTGTEKPHTAGDKVRKVSTVTTAAASNGSTQIVLANAADFAIGDDIWIERRGEADGNTDHLGFWSNNYQNLVHTVSNVSSNTITVNAAINYTVVEGALVTRLSRDVTFKCTTPDTDHAHFYLVYDTTWNTKLIMKDVYFKDWGNDTSGTVQGVVLRGYCSTDSLPVTLTETVPSYQRGCWLEGIIVNNYPDSTHQRDYGPLWFYDLRTVNARCLMTVHGDDGISTWYEPSINLFNSIATGNDNFGIRLEGLGYESEAAYLYSSRNSYAYRIYNLYDQGGGVHNIIGDAASYAISCVHSGPPLLVRNSQFTACQRGFYTDSGRNESSVGLNKCTVKPLSGYVSVDAGTGTRQITTQTGHDIAFGGPGALLKSIEHNWEIDQVRVYGYHLEGYWDLEERAWRLFRRNDSSGNATFGETIYVPQGTSFKAKATVKMATGFSGTRPYLYVYGKNFDKRSGGANGNFSSGSFWAGYRQTSQFTSAADSDYETIELTVPAQSYNTAFGIAVVSTSSNATEGYWVKEIKVLLDTPYINPAMNAARYTAVPSNGGIAVTVGTSFDNKTRLGGRLS